MGLLGYENRNSPYTVNMRTQDLRSGPQSCQLQSSERSERHFICHILILIKQYLKQIRVMKRIIS